MKTLSIILALIGAMMITGCAQLQQAQTLDAAFNCIFDNMTCSMAGGDGPDAGVDADSGDAGGSEGPGGP